MHKTSSSLMVALAIIALFWGNCLSCPQMLAANAPAHNCCPKSHQPSVKCESQAMQHFVKAEVDAPVALLASSLPLPPPVLVWTPAPELLSPVPAVSPTPPPSLRI